MDAEIFCVSDLPTAPPPTGGRGMRMRYDEDERPERLTDAELADRVESWAGAMEHEYGTYSTKAAPDLHEAARRLRDPDEGDDA